MESAARLAGAAAFLQDSAGVELEPAEKEFRENYLSELRAAMSEAEFTGALKGGGDLKMEEILLLTQSLREKL